MASSVRAVDLQPTADGTGIASSCNRCAYCRAGDECLCSRAKCHGFTDDGARRSRDPADASGSFQRYAKSWCSQLTPIPDGLPLDEVGRRASSIALTLEQAAPILWSVVAEPALLTERSAGVTVFKAIKESGAKPGQTIAIPGAGGCASSLLLDLTGTEASATHVLASSNAADARQLAVQYASAMGLRSIAIDTGAEKKALCEKLGAVGFVDFKVRWVPPPIALNLGRRRRTSSRTSRSSPRTASAPMRPSSPGRILARTRMADVAAPKARRTSRRSTTCARTATSSRSACLPMPR